jgi:hypothetical protein
MLKALGQLAANNLHTLVALLNNYVNGQWATVTCHIHQALLLYLGTFCSSSQLHNFIIMF